ncbi:3-hydroxylacyl-ACP dehydratase [Streptomyces montanus]|uniref:3-hydroxylacyl-ACP dehydratase n=1 Tax=Streptomyces montanus TaxID=2580423 RepID=A0A5R9G3A6_9ACTN|nr:3-hydroxylacyl-ACP dehydratase [Streptomyces montanus]TLS47344.1 3-hydroxylacyl-ACP dehydratase [Streptomyces montanus]
MRFHLIDQIDDWESGARLRGHKVTTADEPYWSPTPHGPVMPGALVLEALAQAGTWLLLLSTGYKRRAALASAANVRWHDEVLPGDVLDLDVRFVSFDETAVTLDGTVRVGDRTVLEATGVMCAALASDQLEDPADTELMGRQLLRTEVLR